MAHKLLINPVEGASPCWTRAHFMRDSKQMSSDLRERFLGKLLKYCLSYKKLHPRDTAIFNIIAKHGRYQIKIGPEFSSRDCHKMGLQKHCRKVEINGTVYHLFVNRRSIMPVPTHEEVRANLRGSIMMKDLIVHIVDQRTSGTNVKIEEPNSSGVIVKERINLAGDDGEQLISKLTSSGRLAFETYKIIQQDILNVIEAKKFR